MVSQDEFFERLRVLDQQARQISTSEEEVLQQFIRQPESLSLAEATELEQRDKTYFVVPENKLANPGFDDDLASWSEFIQARLAAQFVKVNLEYLSIADNPSLSTGDVDFFILAYAYLDSDQTMVIDGKFDSLGDNREYRLRYHSGTKRFQLRVSADGTSGTVVTVSANNFGNVATGQFYTVMGWHDSVLNTINISVNDSTPDSVAHSAGLTDLASAFNLGAQGDGSTGLFDGRIGPHAFWKGSGSIPTALERTWLHNGGNGREYADLGQPGDGSDLLTALEAWHDMAEASGDRADSHGSNDLTDNNTVLSSPGIPNVPGVTATTARDTSQSKTLFGSMASLKIDMTASTGTGDAKRTQTITAAAAEVWSFEAWVHATALTNCKAVLKIEWLDSGSVVLAIQTVEVTAVTSVFTLKQIENQTAPASTANVRVSLILEATASGAVGTAYFDLIRAEQGESAVSDRASRIIVGEFVAT